MTAEAVLAEALGLSEGQVGPSTTLGVTAEWTSLAHMRLVLGIEAARGMPLTPQEIIGLRCHADVVALMT